MDSKELRIGNWVKVENDFERVDNILEDGAYCYLSEEIESVFQPYSFINPIPLTENWLLKFGFDDDSYANFSKKISEYAYLVISFKDYACSQMRENVQIADHDIEAPCKYVHQLQNLYFALKGEELIVI